MAKMNEFSLVLLRTSERLIQKSYIYVGAFDYTLSAVNIANQHRYTLLMRHVWRTIDNFAKYLAPLIRRMQNCMTYHLNELFFIYI